MSIKEYFQRVKEFAIKKYGNGLEGYQNSTPDLEGRFLNWLATKIKSVFKR